MSWNVFNYLENSVDYHNYDQRDKSRRDATSVWNLCDTLKARNDQEITVCHFCSRIEFF